MRLSIYETVAASLKYVARIDPVYTKFLVQGPAVALHCTKTALTNLLIPTTKF
jgi:hypothetical protein